MTSPSDKPSAPPEDLVLGANRLVASAMAGLFPLWSVPMSSEPRAVCSAAEGKMAQSLLRAFGAKATPDVVLALFVHFSRRYSLRGGAVDQIHTQRSAQLLEVYGFGRFVMLCAQQRIAATDLVATGAVLDAIEPELGDASGVIRFYEATLGAAFPSTVRPAFVAAVQALMTGPARRRVEVPRPVRELETIPAPWTAPVRSKLWN